MLVSGIDVKWADYFGRCWISVFFFYLERGQSRSSILSKLDLYPSRLWSPIAWKAFLAKYKTSSVEMLLAWKNWIFTISRIKKFGIPFFKWMQLAFVSHDFSWRLIKTSSRGAKISTRHFHKRTPIPCQRRILGAFNQVRYFRHSLESKVSIFWFAGMNVNNRGLWLMLF